MRKYLALFGLLALGACATTTPVPTVKAQQTLDLLQSTHRAVLRAEVIYIKQPGCGLPASPPPPLCASLAVGKKMQQLDAKASAALAEAQAAIDTAGSNPALVDLAVTAAKLAVTEMQTFATSNGVTP